MTVTHKTAENIKLMLIKIPPENNSVEKFEQLLENLHESAHGETIGFEIVSYNQHIYFYVRVEAKIKELVEGQIYASYPYAEIEESNEYAYVDDDRIKRLTCAELSLTRSDIYPIKTFHHFDGDSLAGIGAILTKLDDNEEAWIQILTIPEADSWSLNFVRKLKMKFISIPNLFRIKNYFKLKGASGIREEDKGHFIEKAGHHAFRTQIKIGFLSTDHTKSEHKLHSLTHAFHQFNTIDQNSFKSTPKNAKSFVENYAKLKFKTPNFILSTEELSTLYHLPNPDAVPNIVYVTSRKGEPPRDLPKEGDDELLSYFGITNFHNQNAKFGIFRKDRRRHLYVVGKSGSGKSKLLELLMIADLKAGKGLGVLDPHGDLVDNILRYIPPERKNDVIIFDPTDTEFPIAFNPLEQVAPEYRVRVTLGFIEIFKKLFATNWSPRLEHVLRYTTLALLDSPNTTILSILKMLTDKNYRQKVVAKIQDSVVKNFWVNEFAGWSEKFDNEAITPLLNKVGQFVSTNLIRNIIGQPQNKINIRQVMDEGKILLMKVPKGILGEENAQLLGSLIITKIYQAAMSRADTYEENRIDWYFYVDEFQNFATDTFDEILSEARKYKLNLTLAHQFMGQLSDKIRKTVFGNVGSMVSFRVGAEDATVLANEYNPRFKERDIINLGVREMYLKLSINGEIRDAFSAHTMSVPKPANDISSEIRDLSRQKYCLPRADVEKILTTWDEGGLDKEGESSVQYQDTNFEEPEFAPPII